MDKDFILALMGSLTVLLGGVRWLIAVYYKQNKKIEELRNLNEHRHMRQLRDSVEKFEKALALFKEDFVSLRQELISAKQMTANLTEKFDLGQKASKQIFESMLAFVKNHQDRMKSAETDIKELSKNLLLVKGRANNETHKENK